MTLRHYEFFVKVCETMNMTTAAAQLYISQSAVSQAIAELESHYGLQLFKRQSNRLYLTQAGERLWEHANVILSYNQRIDEDMRRMWTENATPPLRIGYNLAGDARLIPDLLLNYQQLGTGDHLKITATMMETAERLLLLEELDLVICEGRPASPELETEPLWELTMGFVCNRNTRLVRFQAPGIADLTPEEIRALPFVLQADDIEHSEAIFTGQMAAQNAAPQSLRSLPAFMEIERLIDNDLCIGVSCTGRRKLNPNQQEICFPGIRIHKPVNLLWKRGRPLIPAAQRFRSFLKETVFP